MSAPDFAPSVEQVVAAIAAGACTRSEIARHIYGPTWRDAVKSVQNAIDRASRQRMIVHGRRGWALGFNGRRMAERLAA